MQANYIQLAVHILMNLTTAHKTKIDIPYGKLDSILSWCKTNCESDWQFDSVVEYLEGYDASYRAKSISTYDFYFESEKDYVAFVVWKK